jgi:hypothetical protein
VSHGKPGDVLTRWIEGEAPAATDAGDARERELLDLLDLASAAERPAMSEAEAGRVLAALLARTRATAAARRRWPRAPIVLGLLAAASLAAVVLLAPWRRPAPPPRERIARETVIRTEVDGETVFIHAVAYEREN